ncbi:disease resistance protein RGA5-like [Miscanthus floridulus]|uniref:disease resistance protein RGA5-like n=1 Tax=Miscanthus floridulus TaxID=154761 RepID=UPI00345B239C
MDLVTGAINNLVPKLGELLKEEYKLQKGVRKRVECLQIELESMSIVLHKVGQLMPDQLDEQVKAWAREVRKVSYDMEDILDTFLVCVERHEPATMDRFKCLLEKMAKLFNKTKARHKIATAIKDIKKQLQEVADRRGRYMVGDIIAKSTVTIVDPRLSALYNDVTKLVGINKASDDLISMLSPQCDDGAYMMDKVKKVSILGPGGLGKTTLAKAVYEKLKIGFGCGAFVPVGRNPDIKKVFKDILIDLDKQHYTTCFNMMILDERQLIDELRGFLKNKRYFIVIDDIWETQSWETIKLALIENNCGSRIVITTRKFRVATEVGEVYNINPLSDDESRKLLYSRIFGIEADCLGNLPDKVSDKVLKRCGGVPLAIITMANLLVGKPIEEWPEVHNSIAFSSHKDNHHIESTMRILSFSYYDLPSHLKTCLLYLSMFPDDSIISKDPLIWKWIAEGFVRKEKGIGLFELGEQYFNELINRSMIQAVELEEQEGIVQGCRVHDMVLDLIRSLSHEENFLCVLDGLDREETLPQSSIRRLSHQNRTVEHNPQARNTGMPQLRSFVTCYCAIGKMIPLLSFRVLRVLAIEYCEFKEGYQLEHLGSLLHLRYLGLMETNIRVLPKEIGHLRFLQTLLLNGTGIEELPSSLRLLPQLMCLRADWKTRTPNWIGMLTSLEDLRIYRGANDRSARRFVKELGSLTGLRVLRAGIAVLDEDMERDLVKSLCNLKEIKYIHLEIIYPAIDDTVDASPWMSKVSWEAEGFVPPPKFRRLLLGCIMFPTLPSWIINSSCLLSHLCVHVVTIEEQDLKVIGKMPELHDLLLPTSSTVTISNIAEGGYFKKLRSCSMLSSMVQFLRNEDSSVSFHMWNGEDATPFGTRKDGEGSVAPTVMPCLEFLEFFFFVQTMKYCNGYCSSIGLEYLTALKKVTVRIGCQGASVVEVEEAEAALRRAAEVHPNHPTLELIRHFEDKMILASDE